MNLSGQIAAEDEALDLGPVVVRWRRGDLDAEPWLRSESALLLRPVMRGRTLADGNGLERAIGEVLAATNPRDARDKPVLFRPLATDDEWARAPAMAFLGSVLVILARELPSIAPIAFQAPVDRLPLGQQLMLRLVELEGATALEAGAILGLDDDAARDLLDAAHESVGWDPGGQVLCRGWQAVRAMAQRSPAEAAEAREHLANCRACGRAYADRIRRREWLLRLTPEGTAKHPILPTGRPQDTPSGRAETYDRT